MRGARPFSGRAGNHRSGSLSHPDAFHRLYIEMIERLVVFFTRRIYDSEVAIELGAETFAVALLKRDQFRGETQPEMEAWIFAIARTQLAEYWRKGKVERSALNRLAMNAPTVTEDDLDHVEALADLPELRARIRLALRALPPAQAQAVKLRVVEERSYADIAIALGIDQTAVRARVSRGLRTLQQDLQDDPVVGRNA